MNTIKNSHLILAGSLITIGGLLRLVPHPPNVTPIAAMALLGGAYIGRKYLAFLIPLLALFFSDLILNNTINRVYFTDHSGLVIWSDYMVWTYGAYILAVFIGILFLKKRSLKRNIFGALGASVIFFLVTNVGVWLAPGGYPPTLTGLMACLGASLPFFRNTIIGNLSYVIIFFYAFEYINARYLVKDVA